MQDCGPSLVRKSKHLFTFKQIHDPGSIAYHLPVLEGFHNPASVLKVPDMDLMLGGVHIPAVRGPATGCMNTWALDFILDVQWGVLWARVDIHLNSLSHLLVARLPDSGLQHYLCNPSSLSAFPSGFSRLTRVFVLQAYGARAMHPDPGF
jgi:hypothetical protein